MNKPVI